MDVQYWFASCMENLYYSCRIQQRTRFKGYGDSEDVTACWIGIFLPQTEKQADIQGSCPSLRDGFAGGSAGGSLVLRFSFPVRVVQVSLARFCRRKHKKSTAHARRS